MKEWPAACPLATLLRWSFPSSAGCAQQLRPSKHWWTWPTLNVVFLCKTPFFKSWRKYKCSSSFVILMQVLSAMKNKRQLCKYQKWLWFLVSPLPFLSKWWVLLGPGLLSPTSASAIGPPNACQRDTYLFFVHASLLLFHPPDLQLEEAAHKMVLPLTSALIYWLLPRLGHENLVQTFLPLWWQSCNSSGDYEQGTKNLFSALQSCDLVSVAAACQLFRCFDKKASLGQREPQIGMNKAWRCC